ncbi:hypothetical protein JI664_10340 [Rhodobacter sp. NTK016B]|uniref:hypothetical protein n=1 Tax=Rhodobacter sp. NTK016B TaxID=2759676 RepID=UPI001A8EFAB8|nr:hypothetical protein [Rhodobacter sp. NTK016B]MBN8292363.1 hypothetical protein [Rhodobacter sp. NTK016B]
MVGTARVRRPVTRRLSGLGVLALGLAALGAIAWRVYLPGIETEIRTRAQMVTALSRQEAGIEVSGRDIRVSGSADSAEARAALLAALHAVPGGRVVGDTLSVLPHAAPYILNIARSDQGLHARGVVPSRAAQDRLAARGISGVTLASGAPDAAWIDAALAAVTGAEGLLAGQAELRDRQLVVLGTVLTPVEGAALQQAVRAALPEGYAPRFELSYRDDLTLPAYRLHYDPVSGPWLDGKLPVGVGPGDVAAALGLEDIDTGADRAQLGEPEELTPVIAALRPWLPRVAVLDVRVAADSVRVEAGFGPGADLARSEADLHAALDAVAPGAELRVFRVDEQEETR